MDEAFEKMKNLVANAVALKIPDVEKRFILVTDCSAEAAGAMLAQADPKDDNILMPVAFFHHCLTDAEKRYNTTEKELLAVVLAVKKYRVYLGNPFDLITDHRALRWLNSLSMEDERGRRGRWMEFLQQFPLNPIHKSGKSPELSMADFLSRVTGCGDCTHDSEHGDKPRKPTGADSNGWISAVFDPMDFKTKQRQDVAVKQVVEVLQHGTVADPDEENCVNWRTGEREGQQEAKQILAKRDRLFIDDEGILRIRFNGGRRSTLHPWGAKQFNRIIVPRRLQSHVMALVHDSPLAGHMGCLRTWQRLRNGFWWPGMRKDLNEYIASCEGCGKNKHMNHPNKAPMQETTIPSAPLDRIQVDFLGPFQMARSHNFRYALQIQDVLSRYLLFVPTEDCTADTAAQTVTERWVSAFWIPKEIVSDQGRHFTAQVFEGMCARTGIKHYMGSPGHPQSQGQVERQNQLLNQVRCLADNENELWPEAIVKVQAIHNSTVNATTGFSPLELLTGQAPRRPEDLLLEENKGMPENSNNEEIPNENNNDEMLQHKQNFISEAVKAAKLGIKRSQARSRARQGDDFHDTGYQTGDLVRYKLSPKERSLMGGKLAPRYSGKHRVTEVCGKGWTYEIKPLDGRSAGAKRRHFDDLKTAHDRQDSGSETDTDDDSSERNEQGRGQTPARRETSSDVPAEQNTNQPLSVEQEAEMSDADLAGAGARRSGRRTQPPSRLAITDHGKSYGEKRVKWNDLCESEDEDEYI